MAMVSERDLMASWAAGDSEARRALADLWQQAGRAEGEALQGLLDGRSDAWSGLDALAILRVARAYWPVTERLEKLDQGQQDCLPFVRDAWLNVGLAEGQTERPAAAVAVADAYRAAGLEPPEVLFWLDSPLAGAMAAHVLATAGDDLLADVDKELGLKAPKGRKKSAQLGSHAVSDGDVHQQREKSGSGTVVLEKVSEATDTGGMAEWAWSAVMDGVSRADANSEATSEVVLGTLIRQAVDRRGGQEKADRVARVVAEKMKSRLSGTWSEARSQVYRCGYGQHDAGWLSFHAALLGFGIQPAERLEPLMRLAAVSGWWWPFTRACIITNRPKSLKMSDGRLVKAEWSDGFSVDGK